VEETIVITVIIPIVVVVAVLIVITITTGGSFRRRGSGGCFHGDRPPNLYDLLPRFMSLLSLHFTGFGLRSDGGRRWRLLRLLRYGL